MRTHAVEVLDFVNKILNQDKLATECYLEALATAKQWVTYSTTSFIPHEEFILNIFKLLYNPPSSIPNIYSKCVNIIKRLLEKSKFVKLLENTSSL